MSQRLLIATGAVAVNAADLPFGVRPLIDAAEAIDVTAPTLPSRADRIASDTDRATLRHHTPGLVAPRAP
jgi:hypothetical protein